MPKKLSIKTRVADFRTSCDEILHFVIRMSTDASKKDSTWLHEYAILRLYRSFEDFIAWVLVGCLNQNSQTLSDQTGIAFPKHLSVPVCRYLMTGGGYFDFRGRDGLIRTSKRLLGADHDIVAIVRHKDYVDSLDKLCALRNFAAHGSEHAKAQAKRTTQTNMSSAGAWLKSDNRLRKIAEDLNDLARSIEEAARF